MPSNWKDLRYLQAGSAPQRRAYHLLQQHKVLELLQAYDPILVGTFPLDITVPGSDLDVICGVHNFEAFEQAVAASFAQCPAYAVRHPVLAGVPSIVISFFLEEVEVEIFGQPLVTEQQHGYRHMVVEARLLAARDPEFKQQVIDLKASGIKTEPAFAQLLGLRGDPYQALLTLWE